MNAPAPAAGPLLLLALALCALAVPAAAQDDWLGRDKALHFGVSATLAGAGYATASLAMDEPWHRATAASAFTLSVGAAKELYDATGAGDPSLRDFTWNLIGCAVGIGVSLLIDHLLSSEPEPAGHPRPPRHPARLR